jgi:putative proteasome-type protease
MTFCLGMRLESGLVALADTRLISGSEVVTARKISVFEQERGAMFIMTSGLRSLRDKAVTYFEDAVSSQEQPFDRLFKAVNVYAEQVRQVAREDKESLVSSGFTFDLHALVGGQMSKDKEQTLYMVYPQGNWVEIGKGTPYQIIGAAAYGKPVLDRTLKCSDSLQFALKVGCLAFDSTRISAADVDFPLDVVVYMRDQFRIFEHRYLKSDLQELSSWWGDRLRQSVNEVPATAIDTLFSKLLHPAGARP